MAVRMEVALVVATTARTMVEECSIPHIHGNCSTSTASPILRCDAHNMACRGPLGEVAKEKATAAEATWMVVVALGAKEGVMALRASILCNPNRFASCIFSPTSFGCSSLIACLCA